MIFDISDPGIPVLVASITDDAGGFTNLGGVSDIDIAEVSGRTYAVVVGVKVLGGWTRSITRVDVPRALAIFD